LGTLLPRSRLHWASVCVLWLLFLAYVAVWVRGNAEVLLDPMVQADDARTILFPFHRYGEEHALAKDPVAAEMLSYTPPVVRALYAALVPWTGLYAAPKVVQGLAILMLLWAGWVLLRSRRAGLGAAVVLVFLFLHTTYCVSKIAGGLPRSFAFPLVALWMAGALAGRERVRVASILLGAAIYPVAMVILVAAEGLFALRDGVRPTRALVGRLARYGLVVAVCALLLGPFLVGGVGGDRVHTAAEASSMPVFGREGRLKLIPLGADAHKFTTYMVAPFESTGRFPSSRFNELYRTLGAAGPLVLLAGLLLLSWTRIAPPPAAAATLWIGSIVIYAAAIVLAFRLYSPDRYPWYGGTTSALALALGAIGLLAPRLPRERRTIVRNFAAAAFVGGLWLFVGDGIVPRNGSSLDGRTHASLYAFARVLPVDARIASHPLDGDDLPFWAGRATLGGYETLQPWYVDSWRRQRLRTMGLLGALYAIDREEVLRFAAQNRVTHLLLRHDRYGDEYRRRAQLFEPFGTILERMLADRERDQLALAHVPPEAVVYRDDELSLVDVALLRKAWTPSPGAGG